MKLAKNGGKSIGFGSIPQWPIWNNNTKKELEKVLISNYWAISGNWNGKESMCQIFESNYASFNKVKHCVTFDHGSSSLVAALQALGIGPGDEVIVPALTWVACIISICNVNAIPVIVDIDPNTYCISIEAIKKAITPKTKAIMPVHLYGSMVNMDELQQLAQQQKIFIIEDASHSHGSVWNDKYAGSMGDIGCFSFQQGKAMTSGEGGAAITNNAVLYDKLIEWRTNSRKYLDVGSCKINAVPLKESGMILGTNYCLSEFQAALLNDQLKHLEYWNAKKESNANYLNKELNNIPGISTMYRYPQITKQSYYRYCVKIDNRFFNDKSLQAIAYALECELGFPIEQPYAPIHHSILYKPYTLKSLHWNKTYLQSLDTSHNTFPVAEKAAYGQGLIFHHSILLANESQMDKIVEAFYKVIKYSYEI